MVGDEQGHGHEAAEAEDRQDDPAQGDRRRQLVLVGPGVPDLARSVARSRSVSALAAVIVILLSVRVVERLRYGALALGHMCPMTSRLATLVQRMAHRRR